MSSVEVEPGVDVQRAEQRFHTVGSWLDSRHSFSFGRHYDPANTHFGLLLVSNYDVVKAGSGFDTHPHRDMEIITWVLTGSLVHQDSTGHSGVIYPGLAQRMSAGSGILHSERNDSWRLTGRAEHDEDVRFVQMWVTPDTEQITPGYEQLEIGGQLDTGDLVLVASGMPQHAADRAISIRQKHAALWAARLAPATSVSLPDSPLAHVFLASGSAELEGSAMLGPGDAARVTASQGQRLTAGASGAEILIWEMHAAIAD